MKILIVEDEQRARRGLKTLIESVGEEFEVVAEASNGKQALELLRIMEPELVFTDLKMPYMDGCTFIEEAYKKFKDIKYVIVSAYEDFEVARWAIKKDILAYLVKPIIYDEVKEILLRLQFGESMQEKVYKLPGLMEMYPAAHPLVRKALQYIEKNYGKKINQRELADELGISQEYFCTLFAKDIEMNFSAFVKWYRIEKAKSFLAEGMGREDIAVRTGFSDVKYFYKVFKEITGKSVSAYMNEKP